MSFPRVSIICQILFNIDRDLASLFIGLQGRIFWGKIGQNNSPYINTINQNNHNVSIT